MKNANIFKCLIIAYLVIFGIEFASTNVFAKVNTDYYDVSKNIVTSPSDDTAVEKIGKRTGDTIMQAIGVFLFSCGELMEGAITKFSVWVFNIDLYPWEDLIIYNTLPYLDINFFSYDEGSIFSVVGADSLKFGDVIRNVYYSLLTLALSILGMGVSITAIRLAISSIAAEKAKYKEAIVKCLYTVVMLFSAHFLISFVFYTNETIVKACSSLLGNIITDEAEKIQKEKRENVSVQNGKDFVWFNGAAFLTVVPPGFSDAAGNGNKINDDKFWNSIVKFFKTSGTSLAFKPVHDALEEKNAYAILDKKDIWASDEGALIISELVNNTEYMKQYEVFISPLTQEIVDLRGVLANVSDYGGIGGLKDIYTRIQDTAINVIADAEKLLEAKKQAAAADDNKGYEEGLNYLQNNVDKDRLEAVKAVYRRSATGEESTMVIATLGNYFKDISQNILKSEEVNYMAVILYCMLLVQSLMMLISYIKRVFYVTLLALLAPIVIIYDFFMTAI